MNASRPRVVTILTILAFITIVDRVSISAAQNKIATELGVSDVSFGLVFGAFAIGYAVFMVPSGWAADLLGPRRFLTIIVCLWSIFTIATGMVSNFPSLVSVRVLFGGAESGAFPAAAKAIHNWFPAERRGLMLGLLNTGSRLGAAFGLVATSAAAAHIGWRLSFTLLGSTGLLWALAWFVWFRDHPPDSNPTPEITGESRMTGRELVSFNSAILLVQYFASNFTFFICFSWLLPYLQNQFHLPASQASVYAGFPLYCGALATWVGGLLVDSLYRRGLGAASRSIPAVAGFVLSAITLVGAVYVRQPGLFVALFSLTTFGVDLTLSPSWTACSDLGRMRTATLSGAMNALGSAGAFLSSLVFPWLLNTTHSVKSYFFLAAGINAMAAFCWSRLRIHSADMSIATN